MDNLKISPMLPVDKIISALFVRKDSVYKKLGIDCWDIDRDARLWPGGTPIIAHPPCRGWGRLATFAKPYVGENELAVQSIGWIRKWGGVLEHPAASRLWSVMNLPLPGQHDAYGGFSICIDQFWFGHKAQKKTLLYICGCTQADLPAIPLRFEAVGYTVSSSIRKKSGRRAKPEISKSEREHTPIELAKWLIQVARQCSKKD